MIKHKKSISAFVFEDLKRYVSNKNFLWGYIKIYPQHLLLVILPKAEQEKNVSI